MLARCLALVLLVAGLLALPAAGRAQAQPTNSSASAPTPTVTPSPAVTPSPTPTDTLPRTSGQADECELSPVIAASADALIKLLVLAAILESALALLFNWRPFVMRFDRRGAKPLIAFITALILVLASESRLLIGLLTSYGLREGTNLHLVARVIEAMVIAGGSEGVHTLLRTLGIRSVTRVEDIVPTPKPEEAWIAVGWRRDKAVGPVEVEIAEGSDPEQPGWRVAGQITGARRPWGTGWLFRDFTRFPPSGGRSVKPGVDYRLRLTGMDAAGAPLVSAVWGPHQLADRAVVDVVITL